MKQFRQCRYRFRCDIPHHEDIKGRGKCISSDFFAVFGLPRERESFFLSRVDEDRSYAISIDALIGFHYAKLILL